MRRSATSAENRPPISWASTASTRAATASAEGTREAVAAGSTGRGRPAREGLEDGVGVAGGWSNVPGATVGAPPSTHSPLACRPRLAAVAKAPLTRPVTTPASASTATAATTVRLRPIGPARSLDARLTVG
ncbi:hypothetical protein GCM10009714_13170 [Microlunatus capsulatus]